MFSCKPSQGMFYLLLYNMYVQLFLFLCKARGQGGRFESKTCERSPSLLGCVEETAFKVTIS
jgi:hypothetical protein